MGKKKLDKDYLTKKLKIDVEAFKEKYCGRKGGRYDVYQDDKLGIILETKNGRDTKILNLTKERFIEENQNTKHKGKQYE